MQWTIHDLIALCNAATDCGLVIEPSSLYNHETIGPEGEPERRACQLRLRLWDENVKGHERPAHQMGMFIDRDRTAHLAWSERRSGMGLVGIIGERAAHLLRSYRQHAVRHLILGCGAAFKMRHIVGEADGSFTYRLTLKGDTETMARLIIKVPPNGRSAEVLTEGVQGEQCTSIGARLKQGLGQVVSDSPTEDMHIKTEQNVEQGQ